MKILAFLSSMPFESDRILAAVQKVRTASIAGKTVYQGRLAGHKVLVLNTGIGKVNAAHAATCIVERFTVDKILNIGVAGAYLHSGLAIGDVALASKEIYGDEGVVSPEGWKGMTEIGIPLVQSGRKKYFNEFLSDKRLVKKTAGFLNLPARNSSLIDQVRTGNFVTVSAVSGTKKRAVELEKRFNGICENMEGAAIAQVCAIYNIPFLEIRGISNIAGVRDKKKWDLRLASENCQKSVLEIMKNVL